MSEVTFKIVITRNEKIVSVVKSFSLSEYESALRPFGDEEYKERKKKLVRLRNEAVCDSAGIS